MPLIYITGISGAGKSAVSDELRRRGYEAHDTDRDDNAVWIDRKTGEITAKHAALHERPPGWLDEQEWRMVPERIQELAAAGMDRLVFLCGTTANERDVWTLFTTVIYLSIDETTLRHRLATRTTNDFGKSPHELQQILEWHQIGADAYRSYGAAVVDATQPLAAVVDSILSVATDP